MAVHDSSPSSRRSQQIIVNAKPCIAGRPIGGLIRQASPPSHAAAARAQAQAQESCRVPEAGVLTTS